MSVDRKIAELLTWPEGWDGHDAPKPNPDSVKHARLWSKELHETLGAGLWIEPHISADEEGEVSFEWWKGQKKLTVYVSPREVEYIKVEKVGSSLQMNDGFILSPGECRALWKWLHS
jgi:hypothetical protein